MHYLYLNPFDVLPLVTDSYDFSVTIITGIESSNLVTLSLKSIEQSGHSFFQMGLDTAATLPSLTTRAVDNLTTSAQNTVDSATAVVGIKEFSVQLNGINFTGPGDQLLNLLDSLSTDIQALVDGATSVDILIGNVTAGLPVVENGNT